MNVPSIEDLVRNGQNDLIRKRKEVKELKNDPSYNTYPTNIDIYEKISILERDISSLEGALSKVITTIREDKLNQLGI
jgi:hypothetical protein